MAAIQIIPKTVSDLIQATKPQGGLEFYPHVLYDTATYTSGTTVSLAFFTSIQSDKTLGNMEGASQLPDNQYFEVHRAYADFFLAPSVVNTATGTAAVITGALADTFLLLLTGQGTFEINYANKLYGPEPLTMVQASGGAVGGASLEGAWTAANMSVAEWATNGNPAEGGLYYGGRLIYAPKNTFNAFLRWTAAQTLTGGNTKIRVSKQGVLYRLVL